MHIYIYIYMCIIHIYIYIHMHIYIIYICIYIYAIYIYNGGYINFYLTVLRNIIEDLLWTDVYYIVEEIRGGGGNYTT